MTSAAFNSATLDQLSSNKLRQELISELEKLRGLGGKLTRDQVSIVLGQWFHPLHYFPMFLSRMISVSPNIATQTQISRILWQELGEGDSTRAHETIYISTMTEAGFDEDRVGKAAPFKATRELVDGYRKASADYLPGLGFTYGTEVADLAMVSTIGALVRNCSNSEVLPWVDIHTEQEPDHVHSSSMTLILPFNEDERMAIIDNAEQMWRLWIAFFKQVRASLS
jgi:pyrroloquinoline quinone (PQQ) biosynthesis protein C